MKKTALHARSRPRRGGGFTLMEICVVVALTAVIVGLAYPHIDVSRYKADEVVTSVRSVMQTAQRASLVAQYDVIVSFDIPGGRIRLIWDANDDHHLQTGERVEWTSLPSGNMFNTPTIVGVRGNLVSAPVTGATTRIMDNMPTVTFHRDGSLSSDLEIYMSTGGSTTLWRAVTVVQATGRTDWFRLDTQSKVWFAGAL
jgi:Tfp pilus assembly protein FimT